MRSQTSESAHQEQDDQNDQYESEAPAWTVAPVFAVGPGGKGPEKHQNEQHY